jgi:hypothetical protein
MMAGEPDRRRRRRLVTQWADREQAPEPKPGSEIASNGPPGPIPPDGQAGWYSHWRASQGRGRASWAELATCWRPGGMPRHGCWRRAHAGADEPSTPARMSSRPVARPRARMNLEGGQLRPPLSVLRPRLPRSAFRSASALMQLGVPPSTTPELRARREIIAPSRAHKMRKQL